MPRPRIRVPFVPLTNDEIRDLARVILTAHFGILGDSWPDGTPRARMRAMLDLDDASEDHLDELVRIIDSARRL